MNQAGGRGCGGFGLAIDKPVLETVFSPSKKIIVSGGSEEFQKKAAFFAKNIMKNLELSSGVKIEIKKIFPSHSGFGSGTQLGLSVGKAISLLYGRDLSFEKIAAINKRAGVSGIGYYAFIHGGFIVDGGYRMGPEELKNDFGDHSPCPPALVGSYKFPKNWKIFLITPPASFRRNEIDENDFFDRNTPVSMPEIGAICVNTLMGLIPSLVSGCYFEFIDNLFDSIRFGTKKIELELNKGLVVKVSGLLENILAYKWERINIFKYALVQDSRCLSASEISAHFDPDRRYETRQNFREGAKRYPKDKIPFLALSSLGSAMYSILLEDYHNIDYLLDETRKRLGPSWKVELVGARNYPFVCEAE